MKVTLVLLASDAKKARYTNARDCVVARAINRVLAPGYTAGVGSDDFALFYGDRLTNAGDFRIGNKGFHPGDMTKMQNSGKDRKMVVDIPRKYLNESFQPKPRKDKYQMAIDKLVHKSEVEIIKIWNHPMAYMKDGGLLFSYLTTAPAATGDRHNGAYSGSGFGCISQVYTSDDDTLTQSLKDYIKSRPIKTVEQIGNMKSVNARRVALNEYAIIQRAMDICFRFKTPNVVNV